MQRLLRFLLVLTISIMAGKQLMAQADYSLQLKSGIIPSQEISTLSSFSLSQHEQSLFNGKLYLLLQFDALPGRMEKERMLQAGIRLMDYVPNSSFLAQLDPRLTPTQLENFGVRAVLSLGSHQKLAPSLGLANFPEHCVVDADHIAVSILPFGGINRAVFSQYLLNKGFENHPSVELHEGLEAIIAIADLHKLATLAPVMYIQPVEPTPVPDGIRGRTSHRANTLSPRPGVGFDGTGVVLADADDGSVRHIDFHGRLTDLTDGDLGGDHGDMTLGIAGGAANLNPTVPGMATGADLIIYDIGGYPQIVDAVANFQTLGTVVTTTSYSQGCGGVYEGTARDLDADVNIEDRILHVFSAGNSANSSCSNIYGSLQAPDGRYYGNITGGRKAAKNSIATANLLYNDDRDNSSSRGPCEDGRLKPDISAHGNNQRSTGELNTYQNGGGTSAASPGIAGVAAMLYQAYKEQHNGVNPKGAFMKALLLNTADDMGRPGPDYDFGWGRVNARRALEAMQNNQFISSSIKQDSTHTHEIQIPAGVKRVKVMVLWSDPAGSPIAAKALVNDIDIKMNTPQFGTLNPWVLKTAASMDSIQAIATRGIDRLNNMEQVTLDNPPAGTYSIDVHGFAIPSNEQNYHLVYSFIMDEVQLTYPWGGEYFTPGNNEVVRWEAFGNTGPFTLAYSVDGGMNWTNIASVPASRRYFDWTVPTNITPNAMVRVTRGGQSHTSSPFHIMRRPNVNTINYTATGLTTADMSWGAVNGADVYDVFRLGTKYMDSIGTTTSTSFTLTNLVAGQENWFAVRARRNDGTIGQRSNAAPLVFAPASVCEGCNEQITAFPHFQSFEEGLGNWCNDDGDFFDWTRISGGTASNNTGPNNADEGSFYLYTEASNPNNPNREAILGSPCLNPSGLSDFKMYFSYHMFGNQMGSLEVEITTDNGQTWSNPIWSKSGDQGNSWIRDSVDLTTYMGSVFALRLVGTTGSGFASDIAIDNILFAGTDTCSNFQITPTVLDVACAGQADGSISLAVSGGNGPLSFAWANGNTTSSISNLTPGFYQVSVTDTTGCTQNKGYIVRDATPISGQYLVDNVPCYGDTMGGAIFATFLGGNGGFNINWSNGATGPSLGNLAPGLYTVNVTDARGCTFQDAVRVEEPAPIAAGETIDNITCFGFNNGRITLNPSGGTPGYFYSWNTGSSSAFVAGLQGGNYTVTITDSRNCSTTSSFTVIEPPQLEVDFTIVNESVAGAMDGSATAIVSGGTQPYRSYQWAQGPNQQTLSGLSAGMYLITVSDENLCRVRDTAIVGVEPGVSIEALLELDDVQLYPNPARNEVIISLTSGERMEAVQLQIIDMMGKAIYTEAVQIQSGANSFKMDVSELTAGTYFVNLRAESGSLTRKFVKVD